MVSLHISTRAGCNVRHLFHESSTFEHENYALVSEHYELVKVNKRHPIVLVVMASHAVCVVVDLVDPQPIRCKRHEAVINEVLYLLLYLWWGGVRVVCQVHMLYA